MRPNFKRRQLTPRPGRLLASLALALALVLVTAPALETAEAAQAPVCQIRTIKGRTLCWCRGPYGWRTAPMIACRVWRAQ